MSYFEWEKLDRLRIDAAEVTSAALLILDSSGNIAWHNQQLGRMLGYPLTDLSGRSITLIAPELKSTADSAAETQPSRLMEIPPRRTVHFLRKDGTCLNAGIDQALAGTAETPFTIVTVLGVAASVRTTELMTQMARVNRLTTTQLLASSILHDFNNILAAIAGHARLAREVESREAADEAINEVLDAAARGSQLIQRLRGNSSDSKPPAQGVDWQAVAGEALSLLRGIAPGNIRMDLALDGALPAVNCSESEAHQLVMNLGLNALDAMAQSGGTLGVSLHTERVTLGGRAQQHWAAGGDYVCLSVRDSGCGMDSATLDAAFEPFFSTKGEGANRGLGLAIVRELAVQRHGFVELDSEVGCGTECRVFLPVVTA